MREQSRHEQFERPIVMGQIAMANLNDDFVVNKLNLWVAKAMLAHSLVNVVLCLSERRDFVIIERFRPAKARKPSLDRPQLRRECRAREPEFLVYARHARVKVTERLDDFLEFGRRYLVILGLDVFTARLTVLDVADVDIARAFGKQLVKRSVL
jgi:hypothetical protein